MAGGKSTRPWTPRRAHGRTRGGGVPIQHRPLQPGVALTDTLGRELRKQRAAVPDPAVIGAHEQISK